MAQLLAASHQVLVEIRDGLQRVEARVTALEAKVDRVHPGSGAPGGDDDDDNDDDDDDDDDELSWSASPVREGLDVEMGGGSDSDV